MAYLEIKNISKKFGKHQILENVSIELEKGQSVALAGCNGCGKSTLITIIVGASKCDSGTVLIDGKKLSKKEISELIGYVPQSSPFIDEMTVLDNLKFWYAGEKERMQKDLESGILYKFGLNKYIHYKVGALSGGMKKRLSIACAMANNPSVMVLDEPGAALDLVCKKDIINYLSEYKANGGIVILSSHEEAELKFCDRILLIKDKKLSQVQFGEIENEIRKEDF